MIYPGEGKKGQLRHGCGYALANAGHDTRALQAWSQKHPASIGDRGIDL
jgi:hypothetical protein